MSLHKFTIAAIAIFGVLIVAWLSFWFYSSNKFVAVLNQFLSQQDSQLQFSYSDITKSGFPNRTDVTIHDLIVSTIDGTFVWNAGDLAIHKLVYDFKNYILVFPSTQSFNYKGLEHTLESDRIRTSISFSSETGLYINQLITEFGKTNWGTTDSWSHQAQSGIIALQQSSSEQYNYQFHQEFKSVTSQGTPNIPLSLGYILPLLKIDAELALNRTYDQSECAQIQAINLNTMEFRSEGFSVSFPGLIEADQLGYPVGNTSLKVSGDLDAFEDYLGAFGLSAFVSKAIIQLANFDLLQIDFSGQKIRIAKLFEVDSVSIPALCW